MSDLGQPTRTKTNPKDKSLASKKALKHIVGFLLTIWQICFSLYRLKCRHHSSLPIPAFSKYFLSFLTLVNLSQIVGLLNILNKWRTSINTLPFFVCEKILRRYKCAVTALIRNGSGRWKKHWRFFFHRRQCKKLPKWCVAEGKFGQS